MTVCYCIKSIEETDQNKSNSRKNEEERLKNEEKIAKCEEIVLSENRVKREQKRATTGIITRSIARVIGT